MSFVSYSCDVNLTDIENVVNKYNVSTNSTKYDLYNAYSYVIKNGTKMIISQDKVNEADGYELFVYSVDRKEYDLYKIEGVNSTTKTVEMNKYGIYVMGVRAYNEHGCSAQTVSVSDNCTTIKTTDGNVTSGQYILTILKNPEIENINEE